jgi:nitroreductase
LDLDTVDRLLTTTRAVRRRLDLDRPVHLDVIRECLGLAVQAPTGSNMEWWRWIVVTDPDIRGRLADLYRSSMPEGDPALPAEAGEFLDLDRQARVMASSRFLADHLHEVPVLVVPCTKDAGGAAGWPPSIYPAVWSFILALRSRGMGSVITTVHLNRRTEAAELLKIPGDYVQSCLLPVAYYKGDDFKPAKRRGVDEVAFLDRWGEQL